MNGFLFILLFNSSVDHVNLFPWWAARAFPNTNNCVPLYPFDLNLFSLIHQSLNTERDLVIAFNIRRQVKVAVSISSIDLMTVAHERNPHQVDL